MSWVITGSEKTPVDKLGIQNVSLLLHGNADGSGNILDSSPSPKTVSKFGNTASATPPSYPNSNSSFGNAIAFDGTGDNLRIETATISNYFGADLFTIELWMYRAGNGSGGDPSVLFDGILGGNSGTTSVCGVYIRRTDRKVSFFDGATLFETTSSITNNVWHHIAVTRDGSNNLKVFIDGVAGVASSTSRNISSSSLLYVGSDNTSAVSGNGNHFYNGYIDDLRITKGIARYTSNFTPPTAPFPDI